MLVLSLFQMSPSLFAQWMHSFSIDGDLSKIDSADHVKKVVLWYNVGEKQISDTGNVNNGKYHFNGQIAQSNHGQEDKLQ